MNFEEYVGGKTIAVVGPAPMLTDQSADIDAHDVVIRPAQYAHLGGWYGTRTDVAFLNGAMGRTILDDDQAHVLRHIVDVPWWVYKQRNRQYRTAESSRVAHPVPHVSNPNQVTSILWDLWHYGPASITVYGADLYASGPGNAYYDGYTKHEVARQARAFLTHQPLEQLRAHRRMLETGLIVGDDRYLAAASMTDQQYQAVIDSWQTAAEPLDSSHP